MTSLGVYVFELEVSDSIDTTTDITTVTVDPPATPSTFDFTIIGITDTASGYDNVTGIYSSVEIEPTIGYTGSAPFDASLFPIPYRSVLGSVNDDRTISSGIINSGGNRTGTNPFSDVLIGTYPTVSRVNLDGTTIAGESNTTNNEFTSSVTLLPSSPPPMSISTNPILTQPGEQVQVSWEVEVEYPMECTVTGPGLSDTFTIGGVGDPTVVIDSDLVSVQNTTDYVLSCTDQITFTTFTAPEATVNVVPTVQEI
jgi:hypothetical protein